MSLILVYFHFRKAIFSKFLLIPIYIISVFFSHFPECLNPFRVINSPHCFWQGNLLLVVILVIKVPTVSAAASIYCIGVAVIGNNIIFYSQSNLTVIFETQLVKQFNTSYPLSSGIIKKKQKKTAVICHVFLSQSIIIKSNQHSCWCSIYHLNLKTIAIYQWWIELFTRLLNSFFQLWGESKHF